MLTFGNFCSIASGLKIISGQHPCVENPQAVTQFPFKEVWDVDYYPSKMDGNVIIGNDVWIGEDVSILEGVTVGDGSIIGSNSVIGSNVPPYTVAIGNPWKVLRKRFTNEQIRRLSLIKWWEWEDKEIKVAISHMRDIDLFIEKYIKIV